MTTELWTEALDLATKWVDHKILMDYAEWAELAIGYAVLSFFLTALLACLVRLVWTETR